MSRNSAVLLSLDPLEAVTTTNRLYIDSWSSTRSGSARLAHGVLRGGPRERSGKWRRQGSALRELTRRGTHPGQRRQEYNIRRNTACTVAKSEGDGNVIKGRAVGRSHRYWTEPPPHSGDTGRARGAGLAISPSCLPGHEACPRRGSATAGPGAPILLAQNSVSHHKGCLWVWRCLWRQVPSPRSLVHGDAVSRGWQSTPALPLTHCVTVGSRRLSPASSAHLERCFSKD